MSNFKIKTKAEFEQHLEKDEYSKSEVARMLNREADFTAKKATENMVTAEEFNSVNEELTMVRDELSPYKEKEFNDMVSSEFNKLNGDVSRTDDLIKITGINKDMTVEEVNENIASLKETGKYDFMFTNKSSGGAGHQEENKNFDKKTVIKDFTPKSSGGFLNNLFKKK